MNYSRIMGKINDSNLLDSTLFFRSKLKIFSDFVNYVDVSFLKIVLIFV